MNEFIVKTSLRKSIIYLLGCLLFVVVGIFILSIANDISGKIIGFASIIFFGFGFIFLLYQVLNPRPRIIVDKNGITDRTLGIGRINWEDIEYAALNSTSSIAFIILELKGVENYLAKTSIFKRKLGRINKIMGFGEFNINLSLADAEPQVVFELMRKFIIEKTTGI